MYRMHVFAVPGLWWLVGLVCLVVLVVAIAGLIVATRSNRQSPPPQQPWQPPYSGVAPMAPGQPPAPPRPNPHDILRERLARGEITVEEFERTRAALGPDPSTPPSSQPPT